MPCLYLDPGACYRGCWHPAGRRDIESQLDKRGARRTAQLHLQSYPSCHLRRLYSPIDHEEVPRETGSLSANTATHVNAGEMLSQMCL